MSENRTRIHGCLMEIWMQTRDINVECTQQRFEEILKLIGRNNSYN